MQNHDSISEATNELASAAKEVARSARNMAARFAQQTENGIADNRYTKPIIWGALSVMAGALISLMAYRGKGGRMWNAMEDAVEQAGDMAQRAMPTRVRQARRAASELMGTAPKKRGRKRKARRARAGGTRRSRQQAAQAGNESIH